MLYALFTIYFGLDVVRINLLLNLSVYVYIRHTKQVRGVLKCSHFSQLLVWGKLPNDWMRNLRNNSVLIKYDISGKSGHVIDLYFFGTWGRSYLVECIDYSDMFFEHLRENSRGVTFHVYCFTCHLVKHDWFFPPIKFVC